MKQSVENTQSVGNRFSDANASYFDEILQKSRIANWKVLGTNVGSHEEHFLLILTFSEGNERNVC